jgi:hypothetical protein
MLFKELPEVTGKTSLFDQSLPVVEMRGDRSALN